MTEHSILYFRDMGGGNWWWECSCGHKDWAPNPDLLLAKMDVHLANQKAIARAEARVLQHVNQSLHELEVDS